MTRLSRSCLVGVYLSLAAIALLLPSCIRIEKTIFESSDERLQAIIAAIEAYQQDKGVPPEALSDLLPTYLDEIKLPSWAQGIEYCPDCEEGIWSVVIIDGHGCPNTYIPGQSWGGILCVPTPSVR